MDIPLGDEENNKEGSDKFGKVVDTLHKKQALPSLRTYQGDMAEFIKEKNESVISVAVKEKERREEREKKLPPGEIKISSPAKKSRLKANLLMAFLSLVLLGGGGLAAMYVVSMFNKEPAPRTPLLEEKIIPYNNSIVLANITAANFGAGFSSLTPPNGVNLVDVSDPAGLNISSIKGLFDFLKVPLPVGLSRTLREDYMLGLYSEGGNKYSFLVISVNDFGRAFSGMLEWEKSMMEDLSFLDIGPKQDMTSLMSSTTTIPSKQEAWRWKDIIVKNKDTRGLANEAGKSKIAYTFLDKNTILIVNDISAIGGLYSIYASRSVAR